MVTTSERVDLLRAAHKQVAEAYDRLTLVWDLLFEAGNVAVWERKRVNQALVDLDTVVCALVRKEQDGGER